MRAVIVSGLSGSGKSSAIKALEDLGYFCIDNLPVPLIRSFLELSSQSSEDIQKLGLVIDVRNRKYVSQLPDTLKQLSKEGHVFDFVFLTASDEVVVRRFSETRRKHPLSPEGSLLESVQKERQLLDPLFKASNYVIDTSEMKSSDLRQQFLKRYSSPTEQQTLSVQVISFGFKHGLPLQADLVLDVRFLPNPFFKEELKKKNGTDPTVIEFVMAQSDTTALLKEYDRLLKYLLPRYDREGKSYLTIAIGCTGGKHRSVVVSAQLAAFCEKLGFSTKLLHRDIERE